MRTKFDDKILPFTLQVARLNLAVSGLNPQVYDSLPPCHRKFVLSAQEAQPPLKYEAPGGDTITLALREDAAAKDLSNSECLWQSENWELWQDGLGCYSFISHHDGRDFQIDLDADFSNGEICGDLAAEPGQVFYPFEHMGILLYVNWLANFGDLLLHASGVSHEGRGYCFVGESGAGKSTLLAALASQKGFTALGEDQVIIRLIDNEFWLFGTPWHTQPDLCSPLGVPLERVIFLDRTREPQLSAVAPAEGVMRLLQTAFIPYYRPVAVEAQLERMARLAETKPFSLLSYRLGDNVTRLIFDA